MMVSVKDFIKNSEERFIMLCEEWADTVDWNIYEDKSHFDVKYGRDKSQYYTGMSMFSESILRHIDVNECMYFRLLCHKPQKINKNDYSSYYFDKGKLVMSEFDLYRQSEITFYRETPGIKIQISFLVTKNESSSEKYLNFLNVFDMANNASDQPKKQLYSLEYAEYDNMNRLVNLEYYEKQFKPPFGVIITGEYYEYGGLKLVHAVKYSKYNKNSEMCNKITNEIKPNLIFNPEIYHYDFEYSDKTVICKKTRFYTADENLITQSELKQSELCKLKKYGVDCFGI